MLAMASLGLITILDQTEITGGRAGKVEGLDNGRISLGRVSKMMRNSVDVEVCLKHKLELTVKIVICTFSHRPKCVGARVFRARLGNY